MTILVEGGLGGGAFIYASYRGLPWRWEITALNFLWAILLTIPLVVVNLALLLRKLNEFYFFEHTHEFIKTIVKPFCDSLSYRDALVVSLFAGFGEELIFRGVLLPETGLVISSLLFSIVHFASKAFYFKLMTILYFGIGLYLGLIYQKTDSLFLVICIHALYDFVAILCLKKYRPKTF